MVVLPDIYIHISETQYKEIHHYNSQKLNKRRKHEINSDIPWLIWTT